MTLISIILWPFKVLKFGNAFIFWLRTSNGSGFIYIYIYMERNKSLKIHFYFWIRKLQTFQKQFFVLNTYHQLLLTTHKNILSFTKFSGKRKYYREFISYEQCRLARIISKGGWTVVSWGQRAKTICLTTSDIP